MMRLLSRVSLRARILAAIVVALVVGAVPAYAYWTASRPLTNTQTLSVGHLDLTTGVVTPE